MRRYVFIVRRAEKLEEDRGLACDGRSDRPVQSVVINVRRF